jgi:predicted phosphodiesterase
MSDIHGCFNTYQKMLQQIQFRESDELYILGDVIDRGAYGIEMLKHVLGCVNINMIYGNHEYMMVDMMRHNGEWHHKSLKLWTSDNCGEVTYDALLALPEEERESILNFVESLEFEKEITVGQRRYLLVHGRPNMTGSEKKKIGHHYDPLNDSYTGRIEQVWGHYLPYVMRRDPPVIFGHTITGRYTDLYPCRILYRSGSIGIDCGCSYLDGRGRLGCLRLDDMQEFYVEIDKADRPSSKYRNEWIDDTSVLTEAGYEYKSTDGHSIEIQKFTLDKFKLSEYDRDMLENGFRLPDEMHPDRDLAVTVPQTLAGKIVTRLGYGAFRGCQSITEISLPMGLEEIGYHALEDCTKLKQISIPSSVRSIKSNAFLNCTSLKEVTISEGVESIGGGAFQGCKNLTKISIPSTVTYFGEDAFSGTKWLKNRQKQTGIVIVNTIVIDGSKASGSVTIPDGVKSIGPSAFKWNKELTEVFLPNSLNKIQDSAFSCCNGLENVVASKEIPLIAHDAFNYTLFQSQAYEKTGMHIVSGILLSIDRKHSKIVDVPNGVTRIDPQAFNIDLIHWIRIPEGVTQLWYKAFRNLKCEPKIILPLSVSDIGGEAFTFEYGCTIFLPTSSPLLGLLSKKYEKYYGYDVIEYEQEDVSSDITEMIQHMEALEKRHKEAAKNNR